MDRIRCAVVGSRTNPPNTDLLVNKWLDFIYSKYGNKLVIVSGGAKGIDSMAADWAYQNPDVELQEFIPDWNKYGRSAGFKRNSTIWANADFGIAFWDGTSRGTQHSFDIAKRHGKPLTIVLTHEQYMGGTQIKCHHCETWHHFDVECDCPDAYHGG